MDQSFNNAVVRYIYIQIKKRVTIFYRKFKFLYIIIYLNRAVEKKSSNGFNIEKKYLKRKKQKLKIKERLMNLIIIFIILVMIKKIMNFYLVVNRKGKLKNY